VLTRLLRGQNSLAPEHFELRPRVQELPPAGLPRLRREREELVREWIASSPDMVVHSAWVGVSDEAAEI
jgi:hypothetical protein